MVCVSSVRTDRHRRRPALFDYLRSRLGPHGGRTAWFNFFVKPFAAKSFSEFWRTWNPFFGYFLLFFVYQPLTRVVPRPIGILITFLACGLLLHDLPAWVVTKRVLPAGATLAFLMFAVGVIVSEKLHMDLSRWPVWTRVTINLAYLAGCILAMLTIVFGLVS